MKKSKEKNMKTKTMTNIVFLTVLFLFINCVGLCFANKYISTKLVQSGQATAMDIALLVKNNFYITDEEVSLLKELSFNEMEESPINQRLMDVGNGVVLNAQVSNVYIVVQLTQEEYQYCKDQQTADFFGISMEQPMDGMWLLNGKIDENGLFEIAQRDDIFRYTVLDETQKAGIQAREAFGDFSEDEWGNFITGYVPIYTVEGNFVGMLGIDMDPDSYQKSAENMIFTIMILFAAIIIFISALFVAFYIKDTKEKEGKRKLDFYSEMSHEMRTPMNIILGMTELSKKEQDVVVLHDNIDKIEIAGKELLQLINSELGYKSIEQEKNSSPLEKQNVKESDSIEEKRKSSKEEAYSKLKGKVILLCEDHPINIEITCALLENVGCIVEVAENGKIGLEKFCESQENHFDAILMDIRMPVMDGIECTKKIRAKEGRMDARSIPIIALTANSYEEDRKATKEAGMNAHLSKPVEPYIMFQTLLEVIE